jgi:protoporphyrinogen/coproporphyrinogen III oxidase
MTGDVIVVGGGPSGLAAAHRLSRAGVAVRVLEAGDRVGGKMLTSHREGFVVDEGAFFLPTTYKTLLATAADIGMVDEIVPGGFILGIVRDGVIHDLDGDHLVRSLVRTRLLSLRAKAELVKVLPELIRARRARYARMPEAGRYDTETVSAWSRSRLSPELQEYFAETVVRGIAATSGDIASRADFLAILALFGGAKLVSFRDGMGSYTDRLARDVKTEVGAEVTSVEDNGGGVTVTWTDQGGVERVDHAAACVIATPGETTARILPGLDSWRRSFLDRVRNGKLILLKVGLSRRPRDVKSTYLIVPRASHPFLTGILFDHRKAPGRAPANKGLLTVAVSDSWSEEHWDDHDDEIRRAMLGGLDQILPGTTDRIEFADVLRWREEYTAVGFYRDLGRFRQLCGQDRRIQLAGDSQAFQNLESATISGQRAAERLLASHILS